MRISDWSSDVCSSDLFNADDVVFSFMRQWDENHPYHKVSGGAYEYFNGMSMPDLIKDIVKVDDYTVKFVLNRPEAPMIANLAMDFASILSAEYADKMMEAGTPEQIDLQPVGPGPFPPQLGRAPSRERGCQSG